MKGILVLENGMTFTGTLIGAVEKAKDAAGTICGEVVFNTGMTGYQEVLTDPSYAGQIVIMTYPLIGNYGINQEDFESNRSHVSGFIVGEICPSPSNFRSTMTLEEYLCVQGIVGLADIDTRQLVRTIRSYGTLKGHILLEQHLQENHVQENLQFPDMSTELVHNVSTKTNIFIELPATASNATTNREHVQCNGRHIAIYDFGLKWSMIRSLQALGFTLTIVPYNTTFEEMTLLNPDGVLLSNGPGDPMALSVSVVPELRKVAETYPVMGICYGHQMLGMAFGARTVKMPYGHRGGNHPVRSIADGKVYITSQNHGYMIAEDSLQGTDLIVTHVNVNDGTVEGIRHASLPAFSVQFHPEACPGPRDSLGIFEQFLTAVDLHTERRELLCRK